MNPPRREKPRPSAPLKTEARRKKPRPSASLKTEVNPARRKRSHPPEFKKSRLSSQGKLKLKLLHEKLSEAAKNPDCMKIEKFWRDWNDSEGFDVGEPALGIIGGPWVVKDVNNFSPSILDLACDCARQAIKYENDDKKSNLELVELVKYNVSFSCGQLFYLTFKAKDVEHGREDVYQAKVFVPYQMQGEEGKRKTEVVMFRKRLSNYQLSKDTEKKLCKTRCRCVEAKEGSCDCTTPGVEKKRKKRCRCGETKEGSCGCTTPGVEKKHKKRCRSGKTEEGCGSSYVSSSSFGFC